MESQHLESRHHHHVQSPGLYWGNFFVLAILMILTVWASTLHFGDSPLGSYTANTIALTIATIKACLVVAIFMGVKFGTRLIKLWAVAGFVWFFMFFIMFCDYATRKWEPTVGWEKIDAGAMSRGPWPDYQVPEKKK